MGLISGNVRKHIDAADFFIADITGANPNVMQEIGAVHYGKSSSPTLLIAGLEPDQKTPDLPKDLQGHITCLYKNTDSKDQSAKKLCEQFLKDENLKRMLDDPNRERFLSPYKLQDYTKNMFHELTIYEQLSQKLPTASAWKHTDIQALRSLLGDEADMAEVLRNRVLEIIKKSE